MQKLSNVEQVGPSDRSARKARPAPKPPQVEVDPDAITEKHVYAESEDDLIRWRAEALLARH